MTDNRDHVALVHDYLTQFGGAEQVLAVLQAMYPNARTLTTLHNPSIDLPGLDLNAVSESAIAHIPGLRDHHRYGLPLYPLAMAELGRKIGDADVVIADSSAWAHQIRVPDAVSVVAYCHSPARFLYGDSDYLAATGVHGWKHRSWSSLTGVLRKLDKQAWKRADVILANSRLVQQRLLKQIGVPSRVVYPPIETVRFRPTTAPETTESFLIVSRLVPHKRIDLGIETCNDLALPLRIIGTGRDADRLKAMAGPTIEFTGFVSAEEKITAMQSCRALLVPGVEDFGMTAVEVQAAGRPVVTIDRGGTAETVVPGSTGVLFHEETIAGLGRALSEVAATEWSSEACILNSQRFDRTIFESAIRQAVSDARGRRKTRLRIARI